MSCCMACKRTRKWRGSHHFRQNSLGHFSPIVPPSGAGFASVASDAGDLLWRKFERSKSLVLLQVGGFDVPLATALCKTFLLRMLNDSWAGRNPTKGCSADWRRRYVYYKSVVYHRNLFQVTGGILSYKVGKFETLQFNPESKNGILKRFYTTLKGLPRYHRHR
jgi:hypothetical protein